jgi:phage-related protein
MKRFVAACAQFAAKPMAIQENVGKSIAWIERALAGPDWREVDASKPGLMHAFVRIAERDGRVLRVVYNPTVHPVRVITVYFDRRLRGNP